MSDSETGKLRLQIVTPYGLFFGGDVTSVTVHLKDGEMGIMRMHTPLVAALVPGETRMECDDGWKYCVTTNGYAEIGHDRVILVVSAAEWPQDIDIKRAEKAYDRAKARYTEERSNPALESRNRHAMERASVRIRVSMKRKGESDHSGFRSAPTNPQ